MIEKGLYYTDSSFQQMIRSIGGTWDDTKHRPIVCVIKSKECDSLFWAVPMENYNHRTPEQQKRLNFFPFRIMAFGPAIITLAEPQQSQFSLSVMPSPLPINI